jgi:hypothetical protein
MQVALIGSNHRVHLQSIVAGRDYGDRIEVMNGLHDGDAIIASPGDILHEGAEVDPIPVDSGSGVPASSKSANGS